MRERLRRERRYSWPELSLAGLGREPRRLVPMARVRRLRHRRAKPQGRLPGHIPIERSVVVHERSESDLPLQQRRAESAHPIDLAVDQPLTCRIPRVLRPGTVDIPPPHGAGGAPVRQGHHGEPGRVGNWRRNPEAAPWPYSGVSLVRARVGAAVIAFPIPAASHAACGFTSCSPPSRLPIAPLADRDCRFRPLRIALRAERPYSPVLRLWP